MVSRPFKKYCRECKLNQTSVFGITSIHHCESLGFPIWSDNIDENDKYPTVTFDPLSSRIPEIFSEEKCPTYLEFIFNKKI